MTAPVVAQDASEKIAMTAPVVVEGAGDSRVVSFGMPRSYTLETLPAPTDPRVEIVEVPAKRYAAMRFFWYRSDERVKAAGEELLAALARDGVTALGPVAYAGYSGPWTPPWMSRHEVMVEISA